MSSEANAPTRIPRRADNDTLIRPWNEAATRSRKGGAYYDEMWRAALDVDATSMITVTSFNEWGEGTQIEAARPHTSINGSVYADYGPGAPDMYMEKTAEWVRRARQERGCVDEGERVEL